MRQSQPSLHSRALTYLARREYSRAELFSKLRPHADDAAINAVLDELAARGLLSEQRFMEQILEVRGRKYGSLKVEAELRRKGLPDDLIDSAVASMKSHERETVRAVWEKKFRHPPGNRAEEARQIRFLQSRGFPLELVLEIIRGSGA